MIFLGPKLSLAPAWDRTPSKLGFEPAKYANPQPTDDPFTELLLARGANPNARASLRSSMHVDMMHEYRDVTPLTWGERFHARELVCEPAMRKIAEPLGRP